MKFIYLDVDLGKLTTFGRLPAKSIDTMAIYLDLCQVEDIDEFYRTTSKFLGGAIHSENYVLFRLEGRH